MQLLTLWALSSCLKATLLSSHVSGVSPQSTMVAQDLSVFLPGRGCKRGQQTQPDRRTGVDAVGRQWRHPLAPYTDPSGPEASPRTSSYGLKGLVSRYTLEGMS